MMPMFENWCVLNGLKPHQASPTIVARFVSDIAPLGISKVWRAVQEISRTHYIIGLADPTLGGAVAAAVNEVSKIAPPRSWPKEEQARFLTLPYDVQVTIEKRERDRDNQVRAMQNEFAKLRKDSKNGTRTETTAAWPA